MHTISPNKRARLLELLEISTHAQSPPLENSDVLKLVFSLLPPSYLFLGSVCCLWRDTLLKSKHTKTTSWRTAVYSKQSFEFACPQGDLLDIRRWQQYTSFGEWEDMCRSIGRAVGKCASKEMIREALHRDSGIYPHVCAEAASSGRVDILEWLFARRDDHCWYGAEQYMRRAASNASTLAAFKCVWKWVWRHRREFTNSAGRTYSSSGGDRNCLLNEYAFAAVRAGLPEAFVWMLTKAAHIHQGDFTITG
eukprot:4613-Heterococcus_DN1.PRE.4